MAANAVQLSSSPHADMPSRFLDLDCYGEECARFKEKADSRAYDNPVVSWAYLLTHGKDLPIVYDVNQPSPSETPAITTSTSVSAAPAPTSTSEVSKFLWNLSTFQHMASENIAAVMDEMVGRMSDLKTAGQRMWDAKTKAPLPESTSAAASDLQTVEDAQNVPSFARPDSKPGQDKMISRARARDNMERVARDLALYQGMMMGAHDSEQEGARKMAVRQLFHSFKDGKGALDDDKTSAVKSDIAKLPQQTFKCPGCHMLPATYAARTTSEQSEVQEGAQIGAQTTTKQGVASEIPQHELNSTQTPLKVTSPEGTVHHLKCMFMGFASSLFVLAVYMGLSAEVPKAEQIRPSQEKSKLRNTISEQQNELNRKDATIQNLEMALRQEVSNKTAISEQRDELDRKDTTIRNLEMALRKEVFDKTVSSREAARKDETISDLRKERGALQVEAAQARKEIKGLKVTVVQAQKEPVKYQVTTKEVLELREAMRRRNVEMDELYDQLRGTQAHVERLSSADSFKAHMEELAAKDKTISELEERLRGVTAAFDSVKGYCARVNDELESRANTITSITEAAKSLQKTLAGKDTEIQRSQGIIRSLEQKLQVEADNNLRSRDANYLIMKQNSDLRNQMKDLACRRVCAQEDLRWANAKIGALEEENELNKGQWEKMDEDGEDDVDESDMQEVEDDEDEEADEDLEVIDGPDPDDLEN